MRIEITQVKGIFWLRVEDTDKKYPARNVEELAETLKNVVKEFYDIQG